MKYLHYIVALLFLQYFGHTLVAGARKGGGRVDSGDIRFWIYLNPNDHKQMQQIVLNDFNSLKSAGIVRDSQVTIITHGFQTNFSTPKLSPQVLKNAYLLSGNKNIILVDWYKLAQLSNRTDDPIDLKSYTFAVSNVPTVGQTVARFCQFLLKGNAISSPKMIHLVGHSLGSHVSGIAGSTFRTLQTSPGSKGDLASIGRITGLDPAFPEYYEKYGNKGRRLDKSDARFVDIVHTNIGMRGTPYQCGHVDFYLNGGGPFQPYCLTPRPGDPDITMNEAITGSCSHRRAHWFFAQTISNQNKYYGCQCEQQVLNSNETATPIDYKCNRISTETKLCMRRTLFGQYVSDKARGLYDVDISLKDPELYYD